MEPNDENQMEQNSTVAVAWTLIITLLGLFAGIIGGILYGGIVLFNWIFN
jgi:hypothetical protein